MVISFTIPVAPISVQHGARANFRARRFYTDSTKKRYTDAIIAEVAHHVPEKPLTGPLEVEYRFYIERPESVTSFTAEGASCDWDNLSKGTQDALSKAKLWKNDKQIVHAEVWKLYAEPDLFPRIEVTIKEYKP